MKIKPTVLMIGIDYTPFTQEKRGNYWWRLEQYAKNVNLIIITYTPNNDYRTITHKNITIVPTNCSRPYFLFKAYQLAKKVVEKNKISLVLTQDTTYCGMIGRRLKKNYDIPLIMNNYTNKQHKGLERILHNMNITCADKIRIESEDQKKMFPSHYENIEIIPIPIDLSSFENKKKNVVKKCFLWVGRLETEKRPELFLEIAQQLPHIDFKMIGAGKLFDKLKKKSEKLNNFVMLGHVSHDELPKYYHEAKALIITSKYEGIPTIVLEAMTAGIPIISTDLEGVKELVEHLKEGYICDDVHELIEATLTIHEDESVQKSMGENAYKKIKQVYDHKKCLKRIQQIWDETIKEHKNG